MAFVLEAFRKSPVALFVSAATLTIYLIKDGVFAGLLEQSVLVEPLLDSVKFTELATTNMGPTVTLEFNIPGFRLAQCKSPRPDPLESVDNSS